MKIVGVVPMRHASERVIGKNFRAFAGKPLYHHIINTLLNCTKIDQVCIDTDSPVILEDAAKNFAAVTLLERPENLRSGVTPMNEVLRHTLEQLEADIFLQTHSTNPLLKSQTIADAITLFKDSPHNDSLFGVTRLQTRLYDHEGEAINHDPDVLLRTQDLPPVFEENSNLYLFSREVFNKRNNRIGYHPIMYEIDPAEAWDIDEEIDFRVAELLYLDRGVRI